MPASLVMSTNFAAGISAGGRLGETGASSLVTCAGGGADFRFSNTNAPPIKAANITRPRSDQWTALPMMVSSAWTSSSSSRGGLVVGWLLMEYYLFYRRD